MSSRSITVWDLPVRLFHWSLVVLIVASIVTINIGGNAVIWHFRCGYAILTLILFRVLWGFAGSRYARFSSFPPNPFAALRYLKNPGGHSMARDPGHNPLGAFSVYALLALLALQVGTGLFANDAIINEGPLRNLVTGETSDWLTRVHKINRWVVIALIVMHMLAIAYYTLSRKESLIQPMIGGVRDYPAPEPGGSGASAASDEVLAESAEDTAALRLRALILLGVSALAVYGLLSIA